MRDHEINVFDRCCWLCGMDEKDIVLNRGRVECSQSYVEILMKYGGRMIFSSGHVMTLDPQGILITKEEGCESGQGRKTAAIASS